MEIATRSRRTSPSANWRAWYDDGSSYSSADVAWRALPADGMVGVVAYLEPPYRQLVTCGDWYWLEDGRIHRKKMHPEWGQTVPPPDGVDPDLIKKSGAMDDDAWERVQAEMMEARTWP